MVQRYTPKISTGTAKSIAKNMLTTKTGKKVSDSQFKEFLKKDKDLKKFVYQKDKSSVKKHEVKKFFNKIVEGAKGSEGMKISRMAKKLGVNEKSRASTANVTMEKLYKHASTEELAGLPQDTGPSKQELRQQKRHENAMKTMHKRDRAEDIRKDPNLDGSQTDDNNQKSGEKKQSSSAPPQRASSGSSVPTSGNQPSDQSASGIKSAGGSVGASSQSASHSTDNGPIPLLIYPLYNLTPNVEGLDAMTKKITTTVAQVLNTESSFRLLPVDSWKKALSALRLEMRPLIKEEGTIRALAREAGAKLITVGSVTQKGINTDISVNLMNVETGQQMTIATIHSESRDLFQIERNIRWQITDTLRGTAKGSDKSNLPNPDDLTELPI